MRSAKLIFWTSVRSTLYLKRKMAATELLRRLETRAVTAEQIIQSLKREVQELKAARPKVGNTETQQLLTENEELKKEVEEWKNRLNQLETAKGIKQIPLPNREALSVAAAPAVTAAEAPSKPVETPSQASPATIPKQESKCEKKKKEKPDSVPKKGKGAVGGSGEEPPVDVGRLDLRVGRIVAVKKHPDADSLYVEEVDVGEDNPRTVVSGLVKHVPAEEMQDRMVVLLCNLKPAKMRGITSEAMVMCASTPEKVEILVPPSGCVPGDEVHIEGYPRVPDAVLNPKKKIFETVAPDLKTDANKIATYKGVAFNVPGKGKVTAPSLIGVAIK